MVARFSYQKRTNIYYKRIKSGNPATRQCISNIYRLSDYRENRVALNANSLADNVELDETVVTVIPTHGAIARATFNAQIGGKVLMTLKYGNKSVPFGAIVTHGENKNGSIVAENGQVYLTGLPQSGKLQVSWGNDKNSNCIVDYKLPVVSPGTLLNQQTAICR
ncbi:TPA: FimD/PapC C-terminal domain-containing protein [Escherichia coli]